MCYRLSIEDSYFREEYKEYFLKLTPSQVTFFHHIKTLNIFYDETAILEEHEDDRDCEDLTIQTEEDSIQIVIIDKYENPIFLVVNSSQLDFYHWFVARYLIDDDVKMGRIKGQIAFSHLTCLIP